MKRKIALLLMICFVIALFSGCSETPGSGSNSSTNTGAPTDAQTEPAVQPTEQPNSATAEPVSDPAEPADHTAKGKFTVDANGWPTSKYEYELPLTEDDIELSLFTVNYTAQYIPEGGMNDIPIWGNMGNMTGVHIEYIMASPVECGTQFATLLAADDIPDITAQGQNRFSGTLWEAIEDEWFVNLANYRDYIPNYLYELKKAADANPNAYEKVFLDDNTAAVFYGINRVSSDTGWCIREDIMQDLNLGKAADIKTIDDLHSVLSAMKTAGADDFYPMALYNCFELAGGRLLSGYNTALFTYSIGYYKRIRNGVVEYCGSTEDDLAALSTLHDWYAEGLIDPNWASYGSTADLDSHIANSKIAYAHMTVDDAVGKSAYCTDPDCSLMPTPRLRLTEDQVLKWGLAPNYIADGSYVVSARCDNVLLALTWCDWLYSDSGSDYLSWGPEGELYYVNERGERRLTDLILNHEAGATLIMLLYGANAISEGGLIDNSRNFAVDGGDKMIDMLNVWDVSDYYDGEYDWHDGIQLTAEQSAEIATYSGDVNSYYQEHYSMFMVGDQPLSEWDSFVSTMNEIGLARILEIYNEAYQAYLNT